MQSIPYFEAQLRQVESVVLKYQSTHVEEHEEEVLWLEQETQLPFCHTY